MSTDAPPDPPQQAPAEPPAADAPSGATPAGIKVRVKARVDRVNTWRETHPLQETAFSFGAGVLFDVATLGRIDDAITIVQQLVYLTLLGALLLISELWAHDATRIPQRLKRAWEFHVPAIHFLFGSLLSSFALFFFLSASGATSVVFACAMFGVLAANEFPFFRGLGTSVRWALFSLCLTSYLSYVFPVVFGFLSAWLVVLSALMTGALVWAAARWLRRRGLPQSIWQTRVMAPGAGMLLVMLVMYQAHVMPPVPLNVQYMGIYHNITRDKEFFHLSHQRSPWRFWQHGDQTFKARPGDKVYVFAEIFAPRSFRDRINIRWERHDEKRGWQTSDVIPLTVTGRRLKGYRGHAYKANHRPGEWRVQVETEDGRAIGYIGLTIVEDTETGERVWREDAR